MKKKQIEKIPYITIPKVSRKKDVKYLAVTAWKNIGHERHIILEVYRNQKDSLQVPIVRYAATKKDWGVFFPEEGVWTRQRILSEGSYGAKCWQQPGEHRYGSDDCKANILYDQADLTRIRNFFKGIRVWNEEDWWKYFSRNEDDIKNASVLRKYQLRMNRLAERIKNTPALREQELLNWADRELFKNRHLLYYRKKGRRAAICCSACGGVTEGAWKTGESYESQYERTIREPMDKHMGACPMCGVIGTYKPQGKAGSGSKTEACAFLADKYLDDGVVLRYIQFSKRHILDETLWDTGQPEMTGAYEELEAVEVARTYFQPGKKVKTDYQKHDPYRGKDFWDDCNLCGMQNIYIDKAVIHPDTWENLKGTFLQYSAMQEYAQAEDGLINAEDYLERYMHFPQIEMLVKMKLFGVVKSMIACHCGIIYNEKADRPDRFLGIRKDRVKLLVQRRGDVDILTVLQMENRMKQNWTEDQIEAIAEIDIDRGNLEMALGIMTIQKLLNNISKYAGCEYGTECHTARNRIRETAVTYCDYLSMRQQLEYDLRNTVYQKPRDLGAAHNRMTMEMAKEEQDKRMQEAAQRFPEIRKQYRRLRNRYFYKDDAYLIRPARSAEEIIAEGRILHHCVGGDNYLNKHNKGTSTILFLRTTKEPEIPYITVEIDKNGRIIQWYGAHDQKPDQENMQRWIDKYVKYLKDKTRETAKRPEQGMQVAVTVGA